MEDAASRSSTSTWNGFENVDNRPGHAEGDLARPAPRAGRHPSRMCSTASA